MSTPEERQSRCGHCCDHVCLLFDGWHILPRPGRWYRWHPPAGRPLGVSCLCRFNTRQADFEAAGACGSSGRSWAPRPPIRGPRGVSRLRRHGGRYGFLVDDMVPARHAVFTFDLPSGRYRDAAGHVDRFGDYLVDTRAFLAWCEAACPDAPVVSAGHSMAASSPTALAEEGTAAWPASYSLRRSSECAWRCPVSGQSRPLLLARSAGAAHEQPATRRGSSPTMPPSVAAPTPIPLQPSPDHYALGSRDPERPAGVVAAAERLRAALLLALRRPTTPSADPRASEELFARAASVRQVHACYVGYYHEISTKWAGRRVFEDLAAWLGENTCRCAGGRQASRRPAGSGS